MSTRTIAGVEVGGSAPVRIMAVINVSPESFYSGSVSSGGDVVRDRAVRFVEEGADFIDIGAIGVANFSEFHLTG